MIRQIEKEELRTMHGREGLVLQGCGGDLKEWTDGINQILEQEGILPKGKRLDDVAVFRNEGMTNLLFFFGEEKPDIGKLAVWRLKTHLQFGGTWMSDYVNNRLGGFLHEAVAEKRQPSGNWNPGCGRSLDFHPAAPGSSGEDQSRCSQRHMRNLCGSSWRRSHHPGWLSASSI